MIFPHSEESKSPHFSYTPSGAKWPVTNLTYSFMPDGTMIGVQANNLNAALASLGNWKAEIRRALDCWAAVTPLTFTEVADSGLSVGTPGLTHGDPRFGDIRFCGFASTSTSWLGYTYYPSGFTTRGGDVSLNTTYQFAIGAYPDLFTIVLHETGHALGLAHVSFQGPIMYPYIANVKTGLHPDDIAGIQALYGKKQ